MFVGGNKVMWHLDEGATIRLAGELFDGDAPPPELEGADQSVGFLSFPSNVRFSAPGCWNLDVDAGEQSLDAIVYVYPAACRPDSDQATPEATEEPCEPPM